MAGLNPTACRRCRDQKLRCSRERPGCARCTRLAALCSYPEPPNRKLLAATRKAPKRKKADEYASPPARNTKETTDSTGQVTTRSDAKPTNSVWLRYAQINPPSPVVDRCVTEPERPEIPDDLQSVLIGTYFTCTFNAPLIFHRPTFDRDHAEKRVPRHTLLAVSALATNFLKPGSVLGRRHAQQLQQFGDLTIPGQNWALSAGRHVLQTIDHPTIQGIQTCQILALYWFSQGDSQRNTMLSGIAYRAIRALLLEDSTSNFLDDAAGWVQAETMRRCFWAAQLVYCMNSDHYVVGSSADVLTMNTILPSDEPAFLHSTAGLQSTLDQTLDVAKQYHQINGATEPSIFAEAMRLLHFWAQIRDHVEAKRKYPDTHHLSSLFALHNDLSTWAAALPPSFVYSKRNLFEQLFVKQQPIFIALHAIHFQCRLVLHSSIVPQFSGVEIPKGVPLEAVRVSAEVALKAAQSLSQLSADVVSLDWDPAQVAPFVGYCMYVASSVHMTVLSQDARLQDEARRNLSRSLKMLKAMKPFWNVLERLWERTVVLYEAQIATLQTNSPSIFATSHNHCPYGSDLDKVAGTSRGAEGLPEPLQHSVLQYGLRKLNHNANAKTSASAKDLEQIIDSHSEDIVEMCEPSTTTEFASEISKRNLVSKNTMEQPFGAVEPLALPPETLDVDLSMPQFSLDPSSDWWRLGWDDETRAGRSFEEFFGLSGRM